MLLRTRFAYHYAERVGSCGKFVLGEGFTHPPKSIARPIEHYLLANLNRSQETFIAHYREDIKEEGRYTPEAYEHMPVWVAVEAFSFGNLSRVIQASRRAGVLDDLATSMNLSKRTLSSQVRSFVYLRNRIAHCAKLWNHSVFDVPGIQRNIVRRTKKNHYNFTDHSVYKIFVALNLVASASGLKTTWLSETVDPILRSNQLLAAGITNPVKYGQMPIELLTSSI